MKKTVYLIGIMIVFFAVIGNFHDVHAADTYLSSEQLQGSHSANVLTSPQGNSSENLFDKIFPIITLFLGSLATLALDWLKDERSSKREKKVRAEEKRNRTEERRDNFQRETLIALQDALFQFVRSNYQINLQDRISFRKTKIWRSSLVSWDVDEKNRDASEKITLLKVRVLDTPIRNLVEKIQQEGVNMHTSNTPQEAKTALTEMDKYYDQINEKIGNLLRTLY